MAITSVGYGGTVDYPDYGKGTIAPSRYTLDGADDWRPDRVTSGADRTVQIKAGTGQGYAIRDTSDADTNYQLPTVASGHQWFMIVARRDWSTKTTTFTHIAGSTGSASLPVRQQNYGAGQDDQPIALVQITAGQQYPTDLRDLRCWAGDGGLVAVDTLALAYLDVPGTRVSIGDTEYTRIVNPNGTTQWDVKAPPEDTGWLTSSAFNVGSAFDVTTSWGFRRKDGVVYGNGTLTRRSGYIGSNFVFVGRLAAGFRPRHTKWISTNGSGVFIQAQVGTDGRIEVRQFASVRPSNVVLDPIIFPLG